MNPPKIINQEESLADTDEKQDDLHGGGQAPAPEDRDGNHDRQPLQGSHDVRVVIWIPIGQGVWGIFLLAGFGYWYFITVALLEFAASR